MIESGVLRQEGAAPDVLVRGDVGNKAALLAEVTKAGESMTGSKFPQRALTGPLLWARRLVTGLVARHGNPPWPHDRECAADDERAADDHRPRDVLHPTATRPGQPGTTALEGDRFTAG